MDIERFRTILKLEPLAIDCICYVIANVGFSKEIEVHNSTQMDNDLLQILNVVQDSDRLDAISALGIVRCLSYGVVKGQILCDATIPPRIELSAKEYKSGNC
jgi:uncharacterized protein